MPRVYRIASNLIYLSFFNYRCNEWMLLDKMAITGNLKTSRIQTLIMILTSPITCLAK